LTYLRFQVQDLHDVPDQIRQLLVHLDLLHVLLDPLLVALQVQRQAVALVAQNADLVFQQARAHRDILRGAPLQIAHQLGFAILEHAVEIHRERPDARDRASGCAAEGSSWPR